MVPETILCYSDQGLGALSARFHDCIREHLCRGKFRDAPRPVLLNSWEAAYFTFDGQTLLKLAKSTAALGIDMIVMDDGWFGKERTTTAVLVTGRSTRKKLGCTLRELIEQINGEGVKFGIWIEPEMVSEDSGALQGSFGLGFADPGQGAGTVPEPARPGFSREEVREYILHRSAAYWIGERLSMSNGI